MAQTNISSTIAEIARDARAITFSWYDYLFFGLMLCTSSIIGIYFGCFGTKQATTKEYLFGGKKMKIMPIVLSLVASHVSGITLLAVPAEVYRFGASYVLMLFSIAIVCLVTLYIYLPVFYKLQLNSTYEYLERRFDTKTRTLGSFLFALSIFLYLPIVIYIPALAFSAASGLNVHFITPVVCGVCIFYTAIGGLKAVVWSDALQFTITMGALFTVFIMGIKSAGGIKEIWNKAAQGQRLDIFDFDPDPTKRDSFWTVIIGMAVSWTQIISINQSCVQKYLALPTLRNANYAVVLCCIGLAIKTLMSVSSGLIMFSKYSECDPFTSKIVSKNDQLLPYYVLDVAGHIPGLPGLFIAGIFCAALSTLAAHLNCLAATIYEDFLAKFIPRLRNKENNFTLKMIVVVIGVLCTAMVYLVEQFGSILQLAWSLAGITDGSLLALFTMGVLFSRINSKGAFYGTCIGLAFMFYMVFTVQYYKAQKVLIDIPKPTSIEGCPNSTFLMNDLATNFTYVNGGESFRAGAKEGFEPFFLFRISFYYFVLIGCFSSVVPGLIISYLTNKNDPPVDRDLLSPAIYFLLSDEDVRKRGAIRYKSVETLPPVLTEDEL